MSLKLNLVVEKPDVTDEFEYIEEETNKNSPSNLYIKGPYMMAEGVNRNNRLYPREELEDIPTFTPSFIRARTICPQGVVKTLDFP